MNYGLRLLLLVVCCITFVGPSSERADAQPSENMTPKQQALDLIRRARYQPPAEKAVSVRKALVLDPYCADAVAEFGAEKYQRGDYKGAIEDCTRALALNPKVSFCKIDALKARYKSYSALKDYKDALKGCEQTIAFAQLPEVAADAAKICKASKLSSDEKKYLDLEILYKQSLENDKAEQERLIKQASNRKDVDELLNRANEAIKKDPFHLFARVIRVSCYTTKRKALGAAYRTKEFQEIVGTQMTDLNFLMTYGPPMKEEYLGRALLYQLMGQADHARADLLTAAGLPRARMRHSIEPHHFECKLAKCARGMTMSRTDQMLQTKLFILVAVLSISVAKSSVAVTAKQMGNQGPDFPIGEIVIPDEDPHLWQTLYSAYSCVYHHSYALASRWLLLALRQGGGNQLLRARTDTKFLTEGLSSVASQRHEAPIADNSCDAQMLQALIENMVGDRSIIIDILKRIAVENPTYKSLPWLKIKIQDLEIESSGMPWIPPVDVAQSGGQKDTFSRWRTQRFPLKVFIPTDAIASKVSGYRIGDGAILRVSFNTWQKLSGGKVQFLFEPVQSRADISCRWVSTQKDLEVADAIGTCSRVTDARNFLSRASIKSRPRIRLI